MRSIEKIFERIKPKSLEEHEALLQERMAEIELEYVDRLFTRQIAPLDEENIDNLLVLISNHTELPNLLRDSYRNRIGMNKFDNKKYLEFEKQILKQLENLYSADHDHWIENTKEYVKSELEKIGRKRKIAKSGLEDYRDRAGLIEFDNSVGFGKLLPNSPIKDADVCIDIHFGPIYGKKNEEVKNIFSLNSLEKLAEKIIDEYPEAKAIVGRSWLLDTPIARRIGFTIYDRDLHVAPGSSFWGQFINSDGQIDEVRVEKFLETGKPEYAVAAGAIMTEDFLRKYLPKERRGKILLKEINPEVIKEIDNDNEIIKQIRQNWDKITEDDIEKIFSRTKIFIGFIKTAAGQKFLESLKEKKRAGLSIQEIDNDPQREYRNKLDAYLNNVKFINKEVNIE